MRIHIDNIDHAPVSDLKRLVEDLSSTLPLFNDCLRNARPMHPTAAVLQELGEALVDTRPSSLPALTQKWPGLANIVDSWNISAMSDTVKLSYVLVAVILGRADLRTLFCVDNIVKVDQCLRWLILHGVREQSLLPFLSQSFIKQIRAPSYPLRGRSVSPLQACSLAERAELRDVFLSESEDVFQASFAKWLLGTSVQDYGLAWLLTQGEILASLKADPSGAQLGSPSDGQAELPPDGCTFPDTISSAEIANPSLRSRAREAYHSFGDAYPCSQLNLSDPARAARAFGIGEFRSAARGGLEILSPESCLILPNRTGGGILVSLNLLIPDILAEKLWIRLRGRAQPWMVSFERVMRAKALGGKPMLIPLAERATAPTLEIAFAIEGQTSPTVDYALTYAVLREVFVWSVVG